jgi:hypothetical protein
MNMITLASQHKRGLPRLLDRELSDTLKRVLVVSANSLTKKLNITLWILEPTKDARSTVQDQQEMLNSLALNAGHG